MLRRALANVSKTTCKTTLAKRSLNFTPIVIEQEGRGERSYDIYSRLLKDRIIVLWGPVNDHMAASIIGQLMFCYQQSHDPITMYINSPGGVITSGLAIYDTMLNLQSSTFDVDNEGNAVETPGCDINTIVLGQAASMGSVLATAGTPGKRAAMPNSRIMVHQPSGGAQGMASDIEIQFKEIQQMKVQLSELYVHHTGRTYEEIEKALDRDTFMSAYEAKEFGLLDNVIDHTTSYVSKKHAFRGNVVLPPKSDEPKSPEATA